MTYVHKLALDIRWRGRESRSKINLVNKALEMPLVRVVRIGVRHPHCMVGLGATEFGVCCGPGWACTRRRRTGWAYLEVIIVLLLIRFKGPEVEVSKDGLWMFDLGNTAKHLGCDPPDPLSDRYNRFCGIVVNARDFR